MSRRAENDLDRVSALSDRMRLDARILALEKNPRPYGAEKLADDEYRIRVGDWRVIYFVDDGNKVLVISHVRRRAEDTYRRR